MRKRGFEKIAAYADRSFPMPTRQTKYSAGYDIYLPESVTIPAHSQKMISTGIKAYMQDDEFLGIHIRSSMAIKRHLRLVNNEGIAQGIFYRYLTTDDDASKEKSVRSGGFGSTTSKEADK